jgi:arylsulfatase A-like enzyme
MSITRREFLTQATAAGVCSATGLLAADTKRATVAPMGRRPNILYVILEDIGPNLSCYGEPLVRTPHLDRFAAEGIRFANAFCTAPVCSASRSALMTGCYQTFIGAHHHRTWEWNKKDLAAPVRHLCDWFRQAGYFTCNLQRSAEERVAAHGATTGAAGNGKIDLNFRVAGPREGDPFDGISWDQRQPGQPFFAHITIFETHKGAGWKLARQQPKDELVDPDKLKLPLYYPDHPVARDEYANYLDAIHQSDGFFAQLLQRLEDEGLARNTIVVVSSDHGPLFRGKQFVYDNGLRIPLMVRFPDRREAGKVDSRLVSGVDIAPTLLGLAGITAPAGAMQGRDILAAGGRPRSEVFAARDRMDIAVDRMRAVRTDRFKYIRNYLSAVAYMQSNPYKEQEYPTWNLVKQLQAEGKLSAEAALFAAPTKPIEELYDLAADPDELRNLALDPAYSDTLRDLRARLDAWVAATDRGVVYEDPVDIYRGFYRHLPDEPAPQPRRAGPA